MNVHTNHRGRIFARFLVVGLALVSPSLAHVANASVTSKASASGVDILAGQNWQYSVDGGKTFGSTAPTLSPASGVAFTARVEFQVDQPEPFVTLQLSHGMNPAWKNMVFRLNGQPITLPVAGMQYKTIPGIDARLLQTGKNVLQVEIPSVRAELKISEQPYPARPALLALKPQDLRAEINPVLGQFDAQHFTVMLTTNVPSRIVAVEAAGKKLAFEDRSSSAFLHRLRVESCAGPATLVVQTAGHPESLLRLAISVPVYPQGGKMRLAVLGDSRTRPKDWVQVAAAAAKEKPQLVIFTGDTVSRGIYDWLWDSEFFSPAKELFASTPLYAVIGNHEAGAPVLADYFDLPFAAEGEGNWAQEIDGVLLIGVDTAVKDWSPAGVNAQWLEKTLAASKARFIFLSVHYPPYSSGPHGRLDKQGLPQEPTMRQARQTIVPLLEKYRATAMFCGHDHDYERSELPDGLSIVIAGGAGAPQRPQVKDAQQQNPYSKVFFEELHYCLLEIDGQTCTMKSITPRGKVLDTRTWKARDASPKAGILRPAA